MITFEQKTNQQILVKTTAGKTIGSLEPLEDGYFYYWPWECTAHYAWSAALLSIIANKLNELNKPWDDQIAKDLSPTDICPS